MASVDLDLELAALRRRRQSPSLSARLRRYRPFDRRAIREPGDRDVYWARVQQRLAESDVTTLRHRAAELPPPESTSLELVG
jgi:hypothetical protein